MSYPATIESITTPNAANGDTLFSVPHDALHGSTARILTALQTKLGVDSSGDTNSVDYKLANAIISLSSLSAGVSANASAITTANTAIATKTTLAAALLAAHPVGSIYIEVTGTNPAATFGGTWTAFGAGQVPVGYAPSDANFGTALGTGGAKTDTQTHNHSTDAQGSHSHGGRTGYYASDGGGSDVVTTHGTASPPSHYHGIGTDGSHGHNISTASVTSSTLQPYIVVYMWQRTA